MCSSRKFLQLFELCVESPCASPGPDSSGKLIMQEANLAAFPQLEEMAAVTVKHPHGPDRRGGAMFPCFCKGAGREDKSALGMRLQRYPCLIRGCDFSDPGGGKAVAPAGSLWWALFPC